VDRGLRFEHGLLCAIDGGKALAAGITRVFGKHAVVQRWVLHKRRDVADEVPHGVGVIGWCEVLEASVQTVGRSSRPRCQPRSRGSSPDGRQANVARTLMTT